jgi:hypothetical protein
VLKLPRSGIEDEPTDDPIRIARVTKEINPNQPIIVVQVNALNKYNGEKKLVSGTVTVFFPTVKNYYGNNDKAIAELILDIYRSTRRIVIDGCDPRNFIKDNSQLTCIDVGMAWRRGSIASEAARKKSGNLQIDFSFYSFFHEMENKLGMRYSVAMVQNLYYLERQLLINSHEIKDVKDIKNDYLTYDFVMSLTVFRKNLLNIHESYLSVLMNKEKREIVTLVIQTFPLLIQQKVLMTLIKNSNNESFRKAILAACKYMNSERFGFLRTHGKQGKDRTKEYLKALLQQSNPPEKVIKQAMQNWLKNDNDSKRAGTNTNRSSRCAFAYDSGLLIKITINGLFSNGKGTQAQRNTALQQMLSAT